MKRLAILTLLILGVAGTAGAYDIIIDNGAVTRGHLATLCVQVNLLTSGVTMHQKTACYSANKQDAGWKDDMKAGIISAINGVNASQMAEDTWQSNVNIGAVMNWLKGQVE